MARKKTSQERKPVYMTLFEEDTFDIFLDEELTPEDKEFLMVSAINFFRTGQEPDFETRSHLRYAWKSLRRSVYRGLEMYADSCAKSDYANYVKRCKADGTTPPTPKDIWLDLNPIQVAPFWSSGKRHNESDEILHGQTLTTAYDAESKTVAPAAAAEGEPETVPDSFLPDTFSPSASPSAADQSYASQFQKSDAEIERIRADAKAYCLKNIFPKTEG